MFESLSSFLHGNPALCLFLSIAIGTWIGGYHVKGVGFGPVVGTLVAAILIGIAGQPALPELLRWSFFYLFLFSIGYSVGPQFFGSLKKEALPQIALAVIVAATGLATVVTVATLFGFDEGLAVGLMSGGMTQSAALGTGLSAIAELPIAEAEKARLAANAPLADAITYGFGDLGLLLFLTTFGPRILGADLKQEAREMEGALAASSPAKLPLHANYGLRAYRVQNPALAGATVADVEARHAESRLYVVRLVRGNAPLDVDPAVRLAPDDHIVLSAKRTAFQDAESGFGPEIDDPDLLSIPVRTQAVVVTNREVIGKPVGNLGADPRARGVYLDSLQRGTQALPREPWVVLERGDTVRIAGAPESVEDAAKYLGVVERDLSRTDLTFLAGGICLGIVLGLLKVSTGGVILGLGTAGSILVLGLIGGWARSRYPVFGAIPEAAQRLLMDIGLIVFVAAVGLHAGPHAVEAYRVSGGAFFAKIFVAGVIVTSTPLAVGLLVGHFVMRMRPMMLLGGLAGAQTCTPGLTALRDASGSNIGTLAYTVPYAIGNILLTIWGPVIVAIMHALRH